MKIPSLAALFLPVLAFTCAAACPAQDAQTAMLVNAPAPSETVTPAPPAEPGSSSALGVFPVQNPQLKEKPPGMGLLDWSMLGAAATLRVLDYTSTEKALSEPQSFHEAMLPDALVKNKPAFAAFQVGTVGLNYLGYRLLVRHDKRSLARAAQYLYVGVMTFQVAHNYQLLGNPPTN
ncbi:MAG: hypothetical protein WCC27_11240 [Acidobacteriaceae bacterium]